MRIVVTGAGGFLGGRLADYLLSTASPLQVTELVLTDSVEPTPRADSRVRTLAVDLTAPGAAKHLIDTDTDVLFHLAAVVSGLAETHFDLGLAVNLDATRALLEETRACSHTTRLIFTSTVGVFGGALPEMVDERTAVMPQTSYGVAKAAAELLVNEYARRGLVDGRVARLPTVSVRAGEPNAAVTSFASGIVREPLNGLEALIPVPPEQELWLASPGSVVRNLVRLAMLPAAALGSWRIVNLPGLRVAVHEMVAALREVAGEEIAARVRFRRDDLIARMVETFPIQFDNTRSIHLGLEVDSCFGDMIRDYVAENLSNNKH